MSTTRKITTMAVTIAIVGAFSLAACKPETADIDPQILEELKTPCNGELTSTFHEGRAGWTLTVSCNDREKLRAEEKARIRGAGGEVQTDQNADKLMSFE